MTTKRFRRRLAPLIICGLLLPAACSDDDPPAAETTAALDDEAAPDTTTAPDDTAPPDDTPEPDPTTPPDETAEPDTAPEPVECNGEPIRFTTIVPVTGSGSNLGQGLPHAITAALGAINDACVLGRPLEIEVCDDTTDANVSQECGRQAAAEGSQAIAITSGPFPNGAEASGLPMVMTNDSSSFQNSSPISFIAANALLQVLASVNVARAAGADEMLIVSAEVPALPFVQDLLGGFAASVGVPVDTVSYPVTTSDFAPIAAQIAGRSPSSIFIIAPNPEPLIRALDFEGITAENTPIISSASLMPPAVVEQLGDLAEGINVVSYVRPYSDTENEGIQQMHDEYEAAGFGDDTDVDLAAVQAWSQVHSLVDALATLEPAELDDLTPELIEKAMVAGSPYKRPEHGSFDFSHPAFTEAESATLSQLRFFNRDMIVLKVTDGDYRPVSGFVDVLEDFSLEP